MHNWCTTYIGYFKQDLNSINALFYIANYQLSTKISYIITIIIFKYILNH